MFHTAKLVSGRIPPKLELVEVVTARINPKFAGQLIKALAEEIPVRPLLHLKRIRKHESEQQKVDVLLYPKDGQFDPPCPTPTGLPEKTAAAIAAGQGTLQVAHVPKCAPDNKTQWSEWSNFWPMFWRIPNGCEEQDGEAASPEDQSYFDKHMTMVLALSRLAGNANAAIIVDPATGEVIAQATDNTPQHPLAHAVMDAVAAAAARDLRLWPVNTFIHNGRDDSKAQAAQQPMSDSHQQLAGTVHVLPEAEACCDVSQHKRIRVDASQPHASTLGDDIPVHSTHNEACTVHAGSKGIAISSGADAEQSAECSTSCDLSAGIIGSADYAQLASVSDHMKADDSHDNYGNRTHAQGPAELDACATSSPCPPASSDAAPKPYLCTTYDMFVLHEPCTMCSMAMVHSRLARVIYSLPDHQHGALGGKYRLHAQKSLNHHYKVYHLPLVAAEYGHGL
eukprot:jgi/Chrzof1/11765/Cz06g09050.t1